MGKNKHKSPPEPARAAAPTPDAPSAPDPEAIRRLTEQIAYDLYEKRGGLHGYDHEDWYAAERVATSKLLLEKT